MENGQRKENYFILLELPFDPPEGDSNKIDAAISKKQVQWSRDQSNVVKKVKASEYLAMLEDIRKVMMDPAARKKEAAEAKKRRAAKEVELDEKLKLFYIKGGELTDRDIKTLLKAFGPFGFTAGDIQARFEKKRPKEESVDLTKVLDKAVAGNIKNYLRQLDMEDRTLYDFLKLQPGTPCSQLRETADAMKKKVLAKGEKTGQDNAVQSLCGLCAVVFKDADSKRKYDNYTALTRYGKVNEAADELARGNQRRIEPRMKDGLIDIAVRQYQLGVSEASVYINNYCAYMGYALPENKIICGLCGEENPPGTTNCVKCGKPLVLVCPSCGAENSNSAKNCSKCGFDLTKMERAVELLQQARQRYAAKSLDDAERLLKEALAFWPKHPDILALEQEIERERRAGADAVAAIMGDIQARRMYAAQTGIGQARAKGISIDPAVSERVSSVLREVEGQLDRMRSASGDEAFAIAMRLSEMISDSDELNQSLKRFPPSEPPELTCRRVGSDLTLSWKASSSAGNISYQLVRKENTPPNGPNDGTVVYTGKELAVTDRGLPENTVFCYAVFASRIGVWSRAARMEQAAAIVSGVQNPRAVGGDEMITLSWTSAPTVTEVRVRKARSQERPQDDSAYEPVPCTRLDGLTVSGLANGERYWFAVSAVHTLGGKSAVSDWVYLSAVPRKPAKPLEHFIVRLADDVFQASWDRSEWDVILFCAKRKPSYAVGTIYDLNDLLSQYQKIDINLKSAGEAEFRLNFVGECYIIPGVINASNVILNEAAYISSVPSVRDISFDLNSGATEMYVNFTWPKSIERALLVWRMDDWPEGADDPLASRVECSKRQYEANEGILLSNPAQGIFHAQVYTYFENDGRRVYSEPCRALLSNEPQREVFYTFKYKKPGLFSKKCRLTVEIEADGSCVFPAFVIVSKFKGMPLKRSDGDVVCTMSESTEIRGSRTFEFDISPLRSETRLKLFFLNDKNYKAFKIACKAGNSI